jgi:hypothetical protein
MAQEPLLWVEVDAHAVRKRSGRYGVGWASAGVAWRFSVCVTRAAFQVPRVVWHLSCWLSPPRLGSGGERVSPPSPGMCQEARLP